MFTGRNEHLECLFQIVPRIPQFWRSFKGNAKKSFLNNHLPKLLVSRQFPFFAWFWKYYSLPGLVVNRMEELMLSCCWWKIWGQLKKSTPPPLFPLRRLERYCCSRSVRPQADGSFHFHWWRAPVPLRPSEGEEGGRRGALFQLSPNFAEDQNQPYHYIANS